jgi:hypothetical protein
VQRLAACCVAVAVLAGCGGTDLIEDGPERSGELAPVGPQRRMTLEENLELVGQETGWILENGLAGEGRERAFRAEILTDRLLESRPPFQWLANGYYMEARLRQVQSMADRIVARLRRGEPDVQIMEDVRALHQHVNLLQAAVREGRGGDAPPPLEVLLAPLDTVPPRP